jgi:hemerythrin-like domain-containing protein
MALLNSLIMEHKLIARLIDALRVYARRLRRGPGPDPADLALFSRAFRELADEIHHEKEEWILLPILARNGFNWDTGVLPEVRSDHGQERYLLDVLQQAALQQGRWSNDDRRRIVATALALVEFQREHMELENTKLYSEVPGRLSAEAQVQLQAELDSFDAFVRQSGRYDQLDAIIAELLDRYEPKAEAQRAAS